MSHHVTITDHKLSLPVANEPTESGPCNVTLRSPFGSGLGALEIQSTDGPREPNGVIL